LALICLRYADDQNSRVLRRTLELENKTTPR
jgi:hypothetical protein